MKTKADLQFLEQAARVRDREMKERRAWLSHHWTADAEDPDAHPVPPPEMVERWEELIRAARPAPPKRRHRKRQVAP